MRKKGRGRVKNGTLVRISIGRRGRAFPQMPLMDSGVWKIEGMTHLDPMMMISTFRLHAISRAGVSSRNTTGSEISTFAANGFCLFDRDGEFFSFLSSRGWIMQSKDHELSRTRARQGQPPGPNLSGLLKCNTVSILHGDRPTPDRMK